MAMTGPAFPDMSLIDIDLPSPAALRGGWAALAAVMAARGWTRDVCATADEWRFHDGAGNWACLRFVGPDKVLLVGYDHEYSETYYGEAANYFGETQTDILAGAPDWWNTRLEPILVGDWIGFVYGWNGHTWQRAAYDVADGFEQLGLLKACSIGGTGSLAQYAVDAPGLQGAKPDAGMLAELVAADAAIAPALLQQVVPGWDIGAGVTAARKFLEMPTG